MAVETDEQRAARLWQRLDELDREKDEVMRELGYKWRRNSPWFEDGWEIGPEAIGYAEAKRRADANNDGV